MGSDERIVGTARVSYGKGTKSSRQDAALIDYLMRNQHTSPLEHVVLEIHCKMPIFVARQWVRHRTARINEISGRYSIMENEFYVPPEDEIRFQSSDNKQGRSQEDVPAEMKKKVLDIIRKDQGDVYASYSELIDDGIARELARINLPLSMYTEWYWQMDLHNLFHFLALRMDGHAQWEIRVYAEAIAKLAKAVAPMAYAAFERNSLKGCRFSGDELAALNDVLNGRDVTLSGSKLNEFNAKMDRIRNG